MDGEGVAGLDSERWRPRVVVVEGNVDLRERGYRLYTVVADTNSIWLREDLASGHGEPLLSPAEASRSWALTRPLRQLARRLRPRSG